LNFHNLREKEMEKHLVFFGRMEFGYFVKGKDSFPMVILHEIEAQLVMTEIEADDFMVEHGYDGYLIPAIFEGEILFSNKEQEHEPK